MNAHEPTAPPPVPELGRMAQLARQQAKRLMNKIPLMGTVSWLMLASPSTRHVLLSEMEWRIMPPLMLNQAKIYLRDDTPVAYVSWARLSPEVARRFRMLPHRLTPAEWKSGDEFWLVDLMAPFGGLQEVMRDLRENLLPGRPIHQLAQVADGEAEVFTWPATGAGAR